ncbi:MAG: SAM-dependent methyltransferase, partial [Pseudanabaena sp.]
MVTFDASSVGRAKEQKLAQKKQVEITTIHADLADFVIEPQTWDGIVSIFCHLPPDLRAKVYRQSVIGLKPNGVFVLEAFAPKQLQYNTG